MKKFLLTIALVLFCGATMAQNTIDLTFSRNNNAAGTDATVIVASTGDVDATGIALEILGVNIVNTIILGYFAKKTGQVTIESLLEVIKETFPGPIGEKNAVAAQKAYDMA